MLNKIKRFCFGIPFTVYFLLFSVLTLVGYFWLNTQTKKPESSFSAVFELLINIALWFSLSVIFFGFLTVLTSWIYFILKIKKNELKFKLETPEVGEFKVSQKQNVNIQLSPILKPLLGFVRIRLQSDETLYSNKFSLLNPSTSKLLWNKIDGLFYWNLPEIREYKITRAIIYFEDFFQFLSFSVKLDTSNRIYTSAKGRPARNPGGADVTLAESTPQYQRATLATSHRAASRSAASFQRLSEKRSLKNPKCPIRSPPNAAASTRSSFRLAFG
jgi:hypothetical protein